MLQFILKCIPTFASPHFHCSLLSSLLPSCPVCLVFSFTYTNSLVHIVFKQKSVAGRTTASRLMEREIRASWKLNRVLGEWEMERIGEDQMTIKCWFLWTYFVFFCALFSEILQEIWKTLALANIGHINVKDFLISCISRDKRKSNS